MVPFGQNVLLWRIHRNLTQAELAARARISRPNLSGIERGKREVSLTTLRSLALALEVNPGTLVDGIGPNFGVPASSRVVLERVADALSKGTPLRSSSEEKLAALLRLVIYPRKNLRRGKRSSERAWLQLKSTYSASFIRALIERVREREHLSG